MFYDLSMGANVVGFIRISWWFKSLSHQDKGVYLTLGNTMGHVGHLPVNVV